MTIAELVENTIIALNRQREVLLAGYVGALADWTKDCFLAQNIDTVIRYGSALKDCDTHITALEMELARLERIAAYPEEASHA